MDPIFNFWLKQNSTMEKTASVNFARRVLKLLQEGKMSPEDVVRINEKLVAQDKAVIKGIRDKQAFYKKKFLERNNGRNNMHEYETYNETSNDSFENLKREIAGYTKTTEPLKVNNLLANKADNNLADMEDLYRSGKNLDVMEERLMVPGSFSSFDGIKRKAKNIWNELRTTNQIVQPPRKPPQEWTIRDLKKAFKSGNPVDVVEKYNNLRARPPILGKFKTDGQLKDLLFTPHLAVSDHATRMKIMGMPKTAPVGTNKEWAVKPNYETVVGPENRLVKNLKGTYFTGAEEFGRGSIPIKKLIEDESSLIWKGGPVEKILSGKRDKIDREIFFSGRRGGHNRQFFFSGSPEVAAGYAGATDFVRPVTVKDMLAQRTPGSAKIRKHLKDSMKPILPTA